MVETESGSPSGHLRLVPLQDGEEPTLGSEVKQDTNDTFVPFLAGAPRVRGGQESPAP